MNVRAIGWSISSIIVLGLSPALAAGPEQAPRNENVAAGRAESDETLASSSKGFGRSGQLMMTGGSSVDLGRVDLDYPLKGTSFGLTYGLDYFLFDHVTVGAGVGYFSSRSELRPLTVSFSASPRVGYSIGLGDRVSLWPNVSPSYTIGKSEYHEVHGWGIGASVPALVRLAPQFFIGAGPQISASWLQYEWEGVNVGSYDFVAYGFTSVIGGWI